MTAQSIDSKVTRVAVRLKRLTWLHMDHLCTDQEYAATLRKQAAELSALAETLDPNPPNPDAGRYRMAFKLTMPDGTEHERVTDVLPSEFWAYAARSAAEAVEADLTARATLEEL